MPGSKARTIRSPGKALAETLRRYFLILLDKTRQMPIYMDRHDLKSVTAKDVAEAHREDLKIQDNYQCKGLTYWFDEERGTAFCLVEAPNEHCVKEMHDNAHGLVPHQIIEVDKNVVNAFLGRIEDPKSSRFLDDTDLPIIDEPAFRTIMCICIDGTFNFAG